MDVSEIADIAFAPKTQEPASADVLKSPAPALREMEESLMVEVYGLAVAWLEHHETGGMYMEDIAQEAVVAAWLGYTDFEGSDSDFYKWFQTILRNKAIDYWRRENRQPVTHYDDLGPKDPTYSPDGSLEIAVVYKSDALPVIDNSTSYIEEFVTTRQILKDAIAEAAKTSAVGLEALEVMYKRRFLGLSHRQIALEQGIEEIACKCRLFRLRKFLGKAVLEAEK